MSESDGELTQQQIEQIKKQTTGSVSYDAENQELCVTSMDYNTVIMQYIPVKPVINTNGGPPVLDVKLGRDGHHAYSLLEDGEAVGEPSEEAFDVARRWLSSDAHIRQVFSSFPTMPEVRSTS